jgi:hypothetical protein
MPFKTGSWGEQAKARSVRRREYFRNYRKQRYATKRGKVLSEQARAYVRYHAQNPEKEKARRQAFDNIDIPEGQLCEECHISLATERHHPDYTKPLEVKFLCTRCNRKKPR